MKEKQTNNYTSQRKKNSRLFSHNKNAYSTDSALMLMAITESTTT